MLSGVVGTNLAAEVPTLENNDFIAILLTGCLVSHFANKAGEIAKDMGGSVNDSFGNDLKSHITGLWKKTVGYGKDLWKIVRKKK